MPNVVVVGAGNAGLCAALAAAEHGAQVTVLERAPREERGGNSAFTACAMRVRYDGPADLHRLMPDLTEAEWENDFGTYPAEAYYDDTARVTESGARSTGNWSGCHAVGWDRNAPEFGDRVVGDGFQKHSYPFGIMVNAHGKRFVDEGADFHNLTYARYGREVLAQPRQFAWQIFDAQVTGLLRDGYRIRQVTKVTADTLEELARKLDGVDPDGFLDTVKRYNEAVQVAIPFNPNVKDGRGTEGITPQKSNWANRIDTPPFEAYMITCGITFTFGGLAIDARTANVLAEEGHPIPGLAFISQVMPLERGDIVSTGTPGAVVLTPGDVVECRITGLHPLTNTVVQAPDTATAPGKWAGATVRTVDRSSAAG